MEDPEDIGSSGELAIEEPYFARFSCTLFPKGGRKQWGYIKRRVIMCGFFSVSTFFDHQDNNFQRLAGALEVALELEGSIGEIELINDGPHLSNLSSCDYFVE